MKIWSSLLLTAWLFLPAAAVALAANPVAEDAGVVQELDFASSALVIDGMSYRVAVDVKVEIDGSHGAFTMLEPGMRVYYEFKRLSPTSRLVTLIRELPADVVLQGT